MIGNKTYRSLEMNPELEDIWLKASNMWIKKLIENEKESFLDLADEYC